MSRRIPFAVLLLALLGAAVAMTLKLDYDVREFFGAGSAVEEALDTPEGRALTLAVIHPNRDRRSTIAREIADALDADPMVAHATAGSDVPSEALIDWLWQARYLLAPPAPGDLTAEAMAGTLAKARRSLLEPTEAPLAARFLLDPAGSFRHLTTALANAGTTALPHHAGVLQTRDDRAGLVFIELAATPFDTAWQTAFDTELRGRVRGAGAEVLIVGPRSVSARIGDHIAARTQAVAAIGGGLVLFWLALTIRTAARVLLIFLPVALGGLAAALSVQLVFGSIHSIALGFGGALLGLAVDYPLHQIGHGALPSTQRAAARKIMIGATTTAVGFAALIFSRISPMAQAGAFVAIGLLGAAAATIWLLRGETGLHLAAHPLVARPIRTQLKLPVLAIVAAISAAALGALPQSSPARLVGIPAPIEAEITQLDAMIGLPSGRHALEVKGATLADLVQETRDVAAALDRLMDRGAISRHASLADVLPEGPGSAPLPSAEEIATRVSEALGMAGLDPAFLDDILAEYRAAPKPNGPGEALPLPPLHGPLFGAIRQQGSGHYALIRLWNVAQPTALASLAGERVHVIDREEQIAERLGHLTDRVWLCFAAGAIAAAVLLFAAVRPWPRAVEIAGATAVACLATAVFALATSGGLGIFQVLALALVAGLGVDYGLFLALTTTPQEEQLAGNSVLVCATTTLIAFVTMALSGVTVLEEIGLTVSAGVVAMLAVHLLRRDRPPRPACMR